MHWVFGLNHFFDFFLIAVGYTTFVLALVVASSAGWLSVPVVSLLGVAIVALVCFFRRMRSEASPLLRVVVLDYTKFIMALFCILIVQFAVLALGYAIPNYSQITNHTTAFVAGCLLVPGCIVGAILSPLSGRLLDRVGARIPLVTGFACMFLSLILFSVFGSSLSQSMFYLFYVVYTIGRGLGCATVITFGLSQLPKDLTADGNAMINSFQQLAGAVGTAVASTIVASSQLAAPASQFAEATALGSQRAFILLAVLMAVALFLCISMTKSHKVQRQGC